MSEPVKPPAPAPAPAPEVPVPEPQAPVPRAAPPGPLAQDLQIPTPPTPVDFKTIMVEELAKGLEAARADIRAENALGLARKSLPEPIQAAVDAMAKDQGSRAALAMAESLSKALPSLGLPQTPPTDGGGAPVNSASMPRSQMEAQTWARDPTRRDDLDAAFAAGLDIRKLPPQH